MALPGDGALRDRRPLDVDGEILGGKGHTGKRAIAEGAFELVMGKFGEQRGETVDLFLRPFGAAKRGVQQLGWLDLFGADQMGEAQCVIILEFFVHPVSPFAFCAVWNLSPRMGRAYARTTAVPETATIIMDPF